MAKNSELSGIYSISFNEKHYVGSTKNFNKRFIGHLSSLKKDKHRNKLLQNIYNSFGKESLKFSILEFCDELNMITEREQFWMDKLDSVNNGFNLFPTILSSDFKSKVSMLTKDSITEEMRSKIGDTHRGKIESEETKKRKSKSKVGEKNHRFGKKMSQETKDKISKAKKKNN